MNTFASRYATRPVHLSAILDIRDGRYPVGWREEMESLGPFGNGDVERLRPGHWVPFRLTVWRIVDELILKRGNPLQIGGWYRWPEGAVFKHADFALTRFIEMAEAEAEFRVRETDRVADWFHESLHEDEADTRHNRSLVEPR